MKTYIYIALIAFTAITCFFLSTSGASAATGTAALCGAANGQEYSTAPTNNALLCARGQASAATSAGTSWIWQCRGSGTYGEVNCSAENCAPPQVFGVCGLADRTEVASAPSGAANLCSEGTPTPVSGNGPWTWSCLGSNNSASTDDASCSAGSNSPTTCIPVGQAVPAGQTQCPTNACFFWVTGIQPSNRNDFGSYRSKIGGTSPTWVNPNGPSGANIVGAGSYPDSYGSASAPGPFYRAANGSFDGLAIGSGTRVKVYEGKNFSGRVLFDQTGPLVVSNRNSQGVNPVPGWKNEDWSGSGSLFSQFTPNTRKESTEAPISLPYDGSLWLLSGLPTGKFAGYGPTSIEVTCSGGTPTPPPPPPTEDPGAAACGQSMTYKATAASETNDFTCPPDRKLWNKADLSSPKVYQSTGGYKGVKPVGTFGCDASSECSAPPSQGRSCVDRCGEQRADGEQWCSYEQSPRPMKCVDGNAQQQPNINGTGCNASGPLRCP